MSSLRDLVKEFDVAQGEAQVARIVEQIHLTDVSSYRSAAGACKTGDIVVILPEHDKGEALAVAAVSPQGKTLGHIPLDSFVFRLVQAGQRRMIATVASISDLEGKPSIVLRVACANALPAF